MYNLRIPDYLAKFIKGLHPELKRKIKGALRSIVSEPNSGKPLKDDLEGYRSLRVGRFRIIYYISEPKEIHIIAVGPRSVIYEETYRLIQKQNK